MEPKDKQNLNGIKFKINKEKGVERKVEVEKSTTILRLKYMLEYLKWEETVFIDD